ncbi:hypothetical protein MNB_SV-15-241 [hydrothermal vent metagenome]|uniref:Uncharacterized protein n=1 Tax=hydrothermal vent metagenome TaxID=652676 RepID=A0A1W1EHK0_9ZZZZ
MSFEDFVSNISFEDLKKINEEFHKQQKNIPTYQYSKIKDSDLDEIVNIEKNIENMNSILISDYSEEDLKANFIIPLINRVDFFLLDKKIRGFYEEKLTYKNDKFILNGTLDFVVSKGLLKSKEPYFFIQEFKRGEEFSNPRPQLLAEMISAVELNSIKFMRGAYVIGAIWNFVILEKLGENSYQYFVSSNFDSTKIEDLKDIYKNLLFIKSLLLKI